jgi:hypothetical protein
MASAATIGFNGDCIGAVTPGPTTLYGHEQPFDILARIVDNRSFAFVTSSRLEDMIDARQSSRQRSRFRSLDVGLERSGASQDSWSGDLALDKMDKSKWKDELTLLERTAYRWASYSAMAVAVYCMLMVRKYPTSTAWFVVGLLAVVIAAVFGGGYSKSVRVLDLRRFDRGPR